MSKRRSTHRVLCAVLFVLAGCTTHDRFGGPAADGGMPDAAADSGKPSKSDAAMPGKDGLGEACKTDRDCHAGWSCDREIKQTSNVSGAPGGQLTTTLFPGGSCSPLPLATYSPSTGVSCDPAEPRGAQGCGSDGVCIGQNVQRETLVGCRVACQPSATVSGCKREGYTCDFSVHACVEACSSDTECRLTLLDSNGDGQADGLGYDRDSREVCDKTVGRCTHTGGAAAPGAACMSNEDCAGDGICLNGGLAGQRFPGGYCSRAGCDVQGRSCGTGATCEPLRPLLSASESELLCWTRCDVGAEPQELRLGPSGHGVGCRAGYRCHYNGGTGAMAGVCVGGVYNEIKTNNLGAACKADADCYSPFGMGRCLSYALPNNKSSGGICTLLDCGAPGLPHDVCGAGNECMGDGTDQTLCTHSCAKANECPMGFACIDDDMTPGTASYCYPVCRVDAECRGGERCQLFPSSKVGQCVLQ